jgi:PPK2 family polyphosphate:nucleotide phosphotransferase
MGRAQRAVAAAGSDGRPRELSASALRWRLRMQTDGILKRARKLATPYCITDGEHFRLREFDPGDTGTLGAADKPQARQALSDGVALLSSLQDMLFAQDRWSVLLIFQAMDAAGKDGAIKHVMSGVNPAGCQVASFKAPSEEELDHDYLWRCVRQLPERGRIGIFNRSWYEEVLIVRVHSQILAAQKLPPELVTRNVWKERLKDMRSFERYLSRNGVVIRKFFLHVSRAEQKKRFLERLEDPEKHWKFRAGDVFERKYWKEYMTAYEDMIRSTATPAAPWYVVPADNKWFTRAVIAAAVVDALASLDLHYPRLDATQRRGLAAARRSLLRER